MSGEDSVDEEERAMRLSRVLCSWEEKMKQNVSLGFFSCIVCLAMVVMVSPVMAGEPAATEILDRAIEVHGGRAALESYPHLRRRWQWQYLCYGQCKKWK